MKSKATITIARNVNNKNEVLISITDDKYRNIAKITLTPEQLALALTGLGFQTCEIERW